jgi:hypothetical protein
MSQLTRFEKDIPLETSAPLTAETNELCSLVLSIIEDEYRGIYYFSMTIKVIDLEILSNLPGKVRVWHSFRHRPIMIN